MGATIEIVQPARFDGAVADEIVASIQDAISDHGSCSVVLAGGKTPSTVYRTLAIPPRVGEIEWDRVRLYLGDERWVPADDLQSNYRLVHETLLSKLVAKPPQDVLYVHTEVPSVLEGSSRYENEVRAAEKSPEGTVPRFDIVLLGVGIDGHTASLYPNQPVPAPEDKRICFAVQGIEGYEACVSLTPEVLFGARRILFIVRGEAKAEIIRRLVEGSEPIETLPAMRYRDVAERVTFFLDSAAAQRLDRAKLGLD